MALLAGAHYEFEAKSLDCSSDADRTRRKPHPVDSPRPGMKVAIHPCMHQHSQISDSIHDNFAADHRTIEKLLDKLMSAFEADNQEEIQHSFAELEPRLLRHIEAEEEFLIPKLALARPGEAGRLLEEHAQIRAQLSDLGTRADLHAVRLESARALSEMLRAHAHKEDAVYGWAETALSEKERSSLLSAIARHVRWLAHAGCR